MAGRTYNAAFKVVQTPVVDDGGAEVDEDPVTPDDHDVVPADVAVEDVFVVQPLQRCEHVPEDRVRQGLFHGENVARLA